MSLNNGPDTDPRPIRITEVGPRDGLQNESDVVSTDAKVMFVDALSKSGVGRLKWGRLCLLGPFHNWRIPTRSFGGSRDSPTLSTRPWCLTNRG